MIYASKKTVPLVGGFLESFLSPRVELNQSRVNKPVKHIIVGGEDVPETTIKDEAHRIVEQLPDDASWEDLIYRLYVRQSIEAGLRDCEAGRVESVAEVRKSFGLPE